MPINAIPITKKANTEAGVPFPRNNERRLANSERERNARQILDDMKRQRGNK